MYTIEAEGNWQFKKRLGLNHTF